jgi:peroxiredoxin Q/BCP
MARKSRPSRKVAAKKPTKTRRKAEGKSPKANLGKVKLGKVELGKTKPAKLKAVETGATKATKTKTIAKEPAAKLALGARAPAFNLPRDGGGVVSLADFAGQKLALYFYPRADTTGCTREAIDFSRLQSAFAKADTQVLGVSADPVPAQDKFKAKYKLAIPLASDEKHGMLEAYGVWQEKSLYGRKFLGIVRSTFLIGPDQKIARIWPKVFLDGHVEEVLAAAKAL